MKTKDKYLMFIQWSEENQAYVGYCPDLFPAGGVCHGKTAPEAFARLCKIVDDTVASAESSGLELPEARTRPMREIEIAS